MIKIVINEHCYENFKKQSLQLLELKKRIDFFSRLQNEGKLPPDSVVTKEDFPYLLCVVFAKYLRSEGL